MTKTTEQLLEELSLIDRALNKNRLFIERYSGKSKEELGPEFFDKLIKLWTLSELLMEERIKYTRVLAARGIITL